MHKWIEVELNEMAKKANWTKWANMDRDVLIEFRLDLNSQKVEFRGNPEVYKELFDVELGMRKELLRKNQENSKKR